MAINGNIMAYTDKFSPKVEAVQLPPVKFGDLLKEAKFEAHSREEYKSPIYHARVAAMGALLLERVPGLILDESHEYHFHPTTELAVAYFQQNQDRAQAKLNAERDTTTIRNVLDNHFGVQLSVAE